MSHLFLIDESGRPNQPMPYEIHGGIVVPINQAWDLIQAVKNAQARLFGAPWSEFEVELKGERLLQKRVFQFAQSRNKKDPTAPAPTFASEEDRRSCAHSFLIKGYQERLAKRERRPLSLPRNAREFTAYGLACLDLVEEIFLACKKHRAVILAAVVELGAPRPPARQWAEMLRKDLVFLFERLFYFMECQPRGATAICVFDQTDDLGAPRCVEGLRLNDCMSKYFTKTHPGRLRSLRILPEPVYARSDLTTLLGIADLAIYTINHVFRPAPEWTRLTRSELNHLIDWIYALQWKGQRENESWVYSIFYLNDLRPKGA